MILPSRYSLAGESTEGGMGDIFHCKDNHLNRDVVLKMLKDEEEERRLLDEKKALLRLRSKHVVQLYDVIKVKLESKVKPALILELIEGEDLFINALFEKENAINVLWQIASGIVDIHNEGVIHRDIKPGNIRVNNDGIVKILDFGLSRTEGDEAKTQSIIGTPIYMAPELWKGQGCEFTKVVDTYAFGVTAVSLLTDKMPKALIGRPPKKIIPGTVEHLCPDFPKEITKIIEDCLKEDPDGRPSMMLVEETLKNHLLFNKHRALIILNSKIHELNSSSPRSKVKSSDGSSLTIRYDGNKFLADDVTGSVSANNMFLAPESVLPDSCVLTFGTRGGGRTFATFDISNPEVMP